MGSNTTTYLPDGANVAASSGNMMLNGLGLDELYGQVSPAGATSFLRDGINSTVAQTDVTGNVTANYAYSPYGDTSASGSGTTPSQYTGRDNDGTTGLYYYRARYYSPQLARFISEDPIRLAAGTNFYAYVRGNPISYVDPLGAFCISGTAINAISGAAGGVVGGALPGLITLNPIWQSEAHS